MTFKELREIKGPGPIYCASCGKHITAHTKGVEYSRTNKDVLCGRDCVATYAQEMLWFVPVERYLK
ncbi:MAG: hypothetical protein KQJ78_11155 [Deltaproteobacteria bacterium]|nr:hypothetical protein [Deltaproteobacteria bacterium]